MSSRLQYLDEMGIEVYVRRGAAQPHEQPGPATQPHEQPSAEAAPSEWGSLECEVKSCTSCELHAGRTQTVFGVGDRNADWLFIGEAPGFEEDRQGEPFVGRAGQLLDRMLSGGLGLDRQHRVYIANTVKCRPPDNRNPRPEELAACSGYLHRQIALIKPRIIIALGGVAANALLQTELPVGRLRGRVYRFGEGDVPLVVTYHPAYLLRSPGQKKAAWADLQLAQRTVNEEAT